MSKFDSIRKQIKRNRIKLQIMYLLMFIISISIVYLYYISSKEQYVNDFDEMILIQQQRSLIFAEKLRTTNIKYEKYETYFNSLPFGSPLDTLIVSSSFGWRKHPVDSILSFHSGNDLTAKMNTNIYATGSGVVIFSGNKSGYGKTIIIQHIFEYQSLYAHLNKLFVEKGDTITKNDTIGLSGRSGRVSGPHLHYEIRIKNQPVYPETDIKI